MAHCLFNRFDQFHALMREGLVEPDDVRCWEAWIRLEMRKPMMQAAWTDARELFRADFGDWIDRLTPPLSAERSSPQPEASAPAATA